MEPAVGGREVSKGSPPTSASSICEKFHKPWRFRGLARNPRHQTGRAPSISIGKRALPASRGTTHRLPNRASEHALTHPNKKIRQARRHPPIAGSRAAQARKPLQVKPPL